jgi:hypothetical protein
MRWAEYVACMGNREVHTGCWFGNMKSPLARPRYGWQNNVHLEVTAWKGVDWVSLAQDRFTERDLSLGFHTMWEFLE